MTALRPLTSLRISDSSLSTFDSTCAKKFAFLKIWGGGRGPSDLPGEVGNALHTGFQSYMLSNDREKALFDMMLRYPIELCSNPEDNRSLEACYATMQLIMDYNHLQAYEIAEVRDKEGNIRPAIEVPFRINLKEFSLSSTDVIPIYYVGFIDAVLFNNLTGEYIVVDLKSTRDNTKDLTAKFAFKEQCIPYALIIERMLNATIDHLKMIYLSVFIDIQKPTIFPYEFQKDEYDIQEWALGLADKIDRIKRYYNAGWWPRNSNACISYRKVCPFFTMCDERDIEKIQQRIAYNFEVIEEDEFNAWIEMDLELAA